MKPTNLQKSYNTLVGRHPSQKNSKEKQTKTNEVIYY